jgi:hypothetical protein
VGIGLNSFSSFGEQAKITSRHREELERSFTEKEAVLPGDQKYGR